MALRGDIPKGQDIDWETAEFRHAADLVRFAKAHYPDMGIGVAGYPAPHPIATLLQRLALHRRQNP